MGKRLAGLSVLVLVASIVSGCSSEQQPRPLTEDDVALLIEVTAQSIYAEQHGEEMPQSLKLVWKSTAADLAPDAIEYCDDPAYRVALEGSDLLEVWDLTCTTIAGHV